jgi:hypothetical protein
MTLLKDSLIINRLSLLNIRFRKKALWYKKTILDIASYNNYYMRSFLNNNEERKWVIEVSVKAYLRMRSENYGILPNLSYLV